jgi:hypothetical protein
MVDSTEPPFSQYTSCRIDPAERHDAAAKAQVADRSARGAKPPGLDGGGGKDQFWQQTLREILGKSLAPLWAAYGRGSSRGNSAGPARYLRGQPPHDAHPSHPHNACHARGNLASLFRSARVGTRLPDSAMIRSQVFFALRCPPAD